MSTSLLILRTNNCVNYESYQETNQTSFGEHTSKTCGATFLRR